MSGGHTPFKNAEWKGFPSRVATPGIKMGNATRDDADKVRV